jgi:hypothetical protein
LNKPVTQPPFAVTVPIAPKNLQNSDLQNPDSPSRLSTSPLIAAFREGTHGPMK